MNEIVKPALGVDLVEVARIERLLKTYGSRFVRRVFTSEETRYCESRPHPAVHFAGRFAAKEAVLKALGTGWGVQAALLNVEVVREPSGSLLVRLHGKAKEQAASMGISSIALSISHTESLAVAQALGWR